MIATLRESKAKLSALVQRASKGEEIVITVRGKPVARICPMPGKTTATRERWAKQLEETRATYSVKTTSSQETMDNLREDRS